MFRSRSVRTMRKTSSRLRAGQRRGRLVEDQQARAVLDGAADLHQSACPPGSAFRRASPPAAESDAPRSAARRAPSCRRRFTQPSGSASSRPRKMFSATVRCGASSDSWCTMAMPMAAASRGVLRSTSRPCHSIWPASRSTHSGDDLHQRGFARAVLAEQQMHFARVDGQVAVARAPSRRRIVSGCR